jgi:N-glycosidase YbiA
MNIADAYRSPVQSPSANVAFPRPSASIGNGRQVRPIPFCHGNSILGALLVRPRRYLTLLKRSCVISYTVVSKGQLTAFRTACRNASIGLNQSEQQEHDIRNSEFIRGRRSRPVSSQPIQPCYLGWHLMLNVGSGSWRMERKARQNAVIPSDGRILFFRRDRDAFGFLSHFHYATVHLDGQEWPTVEHYFQAQRSDNPAYRSVIRGASPGIAKRLGAPPDAPRRVSQQSWFCRNGDRPRSDWEDIKVDVMRRADWAKFSQHPDLTQRLLATRPATIEEDAPFRPFLGNRYRWRRA